MPERFSSSRADAFLAGTEDPFFALPFLGARTNVQNHEPRSNVGSQQRADRRRLSRVAHAPGKKSAILQRRLRVPETSATLNEGRLSLRRARAFIAITGRTDAAVPLHKKVTRRFEQCGFLSSACEGFYG